MTPPGSTTEERRPPGTRHDHFSTFPCSYLHERGETLREGWTFSPVPIEDAGVRHRAEVAATALLRPLHIGDGSGSTGRGRGKGGTGPPTHTARA